jgi:peptidoglycan/LPS O-acetylase OafA/YrhL
MECAAVAIPQAKRPLRLEYIDGLRGLAISLVLLTHAWTASGAPALSFHILRHMVVLAAIPAAGNVGVDLFLVLSGFCLTWPFARDRSYRYDMTLQRFWIRRLRRIVPAYYASIPVVILINWIAAKGGLAVWQPVTFNDIWTHALFVHNLSLQHATTITGAYWSIALEFQLYLIFPLLLEMCFCFGVGRTLASVLALQLLYRYCLYRYGAASDMTGNIDFVLFKSVFARMFEFIAGMAAAFYVSEDRKLPWLAAIVAALVLPAAFWLKMFGDVPSAALDVLWAVGFAALVAHGGNTESICHRLACWRPLVYLGLVSYSVYLIHQPMVNLSGTAILKLLRPGYAFFACMASLPAIVGSAGIFFLLIEKPAIRWFHRRRGSVELALSERPATTLTALAGAA